MSFKTDRLPRRSWYTKRIRTLDKTCPEISDGGMRCQREWGHNGGHLSQQGMEVWSWWTGPWGRDV